MILDFAFCFFISDHGSVGVALMVVLILILQCAGVDHGGSGVEIDNQE